MLHDLGSGTEAQLGGPGPHLACRRASRAPSRSWAGGGGSARSCASGSASSGGCCASLNAPEA